MTRILHGGLSRLEYCLQRFPSRERIEVTILHQNDEICPSLFGCAISNTRVPIAWLAREGNLAAPVTLSMQPNRYPIDGVDACSLSNRASSHQLPTQADMRGLFVQGLPFRVIMGVACRVAALARGELFAPAFSYIVSSKS
jgi:hypothetical protein